VPFSSFLYLLSSHCFCCISSAFYDVDSGLRKSLWSLVSPKSPPKHLFVLSQIALLQSVSLLLNISLTVSSLISSPSLSTPSPVPFNFPICRNLALPYFSL
jgi:hypothetical protein